MATAVTDKTAAPSADQAGSEIGPAVNGWPTRRTPTGNLIYADGPRKGQLAPGSKGGTTCPLAIKVSKLRAALYAAVDSDDMMEIMAAIVVKAKGGNLEAAKVVFERTVGKPIEADLISRMDLLEQLIQAKINGTG